MEEFLDIFDGNLEQIGIASRNEAHRLGLLHQVVHGWIASVRDGRIWLYFQQRSLHKADFPGLYDLAVGGHVGAGESCSEAILREMKEEIGLEFEQNELLCVGQNGEEIRKGSFFDREIAQIYLCWVDDPVFDIGEEVEQMIRISKEEFDKKELDESDFVEAVKEDGTKISIPCSQWCCHDGEYEQFILPYLEKVGAENG